MLTRAIIEFNLKIDVEQEDDYQRTLKVNNLME